jgi:hypothetical protein
LSLTISAGTSGGSPTAVGGYVASTAVRSISIRLTLRSSASATVKMKP